MQRANGVVRVVFATVALGTGVNLVGFNRVIHYGAPASIDDYFQESGRAAQLVGQGRQLSQRYIGSLPSDVPLRKDISDPRNAEIRQYLDN